MALEIFELDKKMLEYSISQFRNIPEYVKICEAFSVGLASVQNSVNYLSDMSDKDKAHGVWLDYIGWLVGNIRNEYIDTSNFFSVNGTHTETLYKWTYSSEHVYTIDESPVLDDEVFIYDEVNPVVIGKVSNVSSSTITVTFYSDNTPKTYTANGSITASAGDINVLKNYYFPTLSNQLGSSSNLSDTLFRNQIDAKIAYNISNGTREDNIRIIKALVNADKVIIENYAPMELEITLYGNDMLTQNVKERIESVLAMGVSVHGNVHIYEDLSYETIEIMINGIVEMTNISEPDPEYDYIDIDRDLDDILEIE